MTSRRRIAIALIVVSSTVLFLVYVPAFPVQDTIVTGHQAALVCAALAEPCPSRPQFHAHDTGYASATYVLFGYGIGPQLHYPLEITVSFTDSTTNVTTARTVVLWDDHTACVEPSTDQLYQSPRCTGP
jgi:hypothetical protein